MGTKRGLRSTLADWDAVRAAYMSGMERKDIEAKFNIKKPTLAAMIRRHGWTELKTHAGMVRTQAIVQAVESSASNRAKEFTEIVANALIPRIQEAFNRNLPTDSYELNAHASALGKLNDIGRKTFGLDQQQPAQVVIGFLQPPPPQAITPTIEAQSLVVSEAQQLPETTDITPQADVTNSQEPTVQGDTQ